MLVYWTMFGLPALSTLVAGFSDRHRPKARIGLALLLIAFAVLIGLRWEVGGDWFNYEYILDSARSESLGATLSYGDPGFGLVSWLSTRLDVDQLGTNSVCGAILIYGLWRFAREQPDPWLAVTAAVPYLIIVVGMGYIRQAAALGFILLALIQFERGKVGGFLLRMSLATLFHATALCVLPLAAIVLVRKRIFALVPLIAISALAYWFLLQDRLDQMVEGYIEAEMDSSGALVRLAMNAVPAILFLALRRRFTISAESSALWAVFSVISVLLVLLVAAAPSSTVIDRVGLYFIPVQLFVFGNLSTTLSARDQGRLLVRFLTISFYAGVLFVWLNYATHAEYWLPYRFYPLDEAAAA